MADNARGVHVSPGVYSREIELTYAVKSLGITTLGLAGETQRGPAFQPIHIENWRQFTDIFGGTNTEKFKGSQYPKYELPYIAKSYLTESKQLEVVRVLGLSGYKAGPAWVVTAKLKGIAGNDGEKEKHNRMVVAVLRSRGHYEKYHKFDIATDSCECPIEDYDRLVLESKRVVNPPQTPEEEKARKEFIEKIRKNVAPPLPPTRKLKDVIEEVGPIDVDKDAVWELRRMSMI
jgi:hypothetical protein